MKTLERRHVALRAWARFVGALAVGCAMGGCASWPRGWGGRPCCVAAKPVVRSLPIAWHLFDVTVLSPIGRPFHVVRLGRRLFGLPVRSLNLRGGKVADSAFFTDRDPSTLSPEQVRWGPSCPTEFATPPFVITKPKLEGKTPGCFVTDGLGVRYLFKLDPVDAPELLSGAEVVTSKLLYALGYHVPSYEIVAMQADDLRIGTGALTRGAEGEARPLTQTDVSRLLDGRMHGGRLRVVASRMLEGDVLGPATFKRFRDCAELRALKLAYAWLNNIDAKDHNSLLVWDGRQTMGYLIDFGTSLGADAGHAGPKDPCAGWLNIVDLKEASLKMITLGMHQPLCDPEDAPVSSGVGFFSAHVDPDRWKPYAPNLAFAEMNDDDARWMAGRMNRMSRAQIEAAVSAGQYSHAGDAAYLVDVLDKRRQAIVDRYLN